MIETGKRDDFGIRSTEYFRSILENFGEDARIYLAYYEGQPIAGSLAIHYGDKGFGISTVHLPMSTATLCRTT